MEGAQLMVSEGNKDSVINWLEAIHVTCLQKKLAAFYLCSWNLREAEFENNELVCFAKEILRQNSIQASIQIVDSIHSGCG